MQYWRLRVNPAKDAEYDVFYKTPFKMLSVNVPRHAVNDGDLLDSFMPCVDIVEEIPAEKYFEHMNE